MTKEKKIEAIYKEMADKKVSFGCRYEHNGSVYTVDSGNYRLMKHGDLYYLYIDAHCNCPIEIVKLYNDFSNQGVVKIIGHPVMIGDVMQYLENKSQSQVIEHEDDEYEDGFYSREDYYDDIAEISDCWSDKRLSIEDQSDECIDYVYSLIKK